MDDLSEQTDVVYGTMEGTAIQAFFRQQVINPYPRMYNFMVEYDSWVPNSTVGKEKVFNSYNIPKGNCPMVFTSKLRQVAISDLVCAEIYFTWIPLKYMYLNLLPILTENINWSRAEIMTILSILLTW